MSRQAKHAVERATAEKERSQNKIDERKSLQAENLQIKAAQESQAPETADAPQSPVPGLPGSVITIAQLEALKAMSDRERRAAVRDFVKRQEGVDEPTRVNFTRLPDKDTASDELIEQIKGQQRWWSPLHFSKRAASKPRKYGRCLVQHKKGLWTCTCPQWKKQRKVDCQHIKRVKRKEGLLDYFSTERRKIEAIIVTPDGWLSEETLRDRAYAEMPERVPAMMREALLAKAQEEERTGRGPKGASLMLKIYGLFLMIFNNCDYDRMRTHLKNDPTLWEFGWTKPEAPCRGKWIEWAGQPYITKVLWEIKRLSPRMVRRIDRGKFIIDGSDYPTVQCDNSCDRKFGPPKPAYRKYLEQIRHHTMIGWISKVVYALDVTTDHGVGSADGAHCVAMLYEAMKNAEIKRALLLGDKAYGAKRNFAKAEEAGAQLVVRERANEDRLDDTWPESARAMAELERNHREKFKAIIGDRQLGEGRPAAIKRRTPHHRMKHRKSDPVPTYTEKVAKAVQLIAADKAHLSKLPEDQIDEILRVATEVVGVALLNEALLMEIIGDFCNLVTMEHLTGGKEPCRVNFQDDIPLPPLKIFEISDYMVDDAA